MSSTTKTVLIVAGTAVGAYVLLRALAPAPAYPRYGYGSSANTAASLVGLLPAAGNFFSNLFASPPPIQNAPGGGGFIISSEEQTHVDEYNAQPGTVFGIAGIDY